ncbi:MAG: stage II sporulation protein M [bacterium]|nr:stage II sporulation protein M [bacterium]
MIIDLDRFVEEERPHWDELEAMLRRLGEDVAHMLSLRDARRFHYLYQRASTDLGKVKTFAAEPELRAYLEALVARAYGEIHETRGQSARFTPLRWVMETFPCTFRRNIWAFYAAVAITLVGALFGGVAIRLDPEAKDVLMPFPHLSVHPSERVAEEEEVRDFDPRAGSKASGTSFYFTHNTKVAITTMALGSAWGIGTIIVLFANGVMVGAVAVDYIAAGETVFLAGWLLPHGVIEIPAIFLAGQAGLVLGRALIGWGTRESLKGRLRAVGPDLVTLIFGVAAMLAWAGFVEAFLSQYHEPVIPYWLKISFGLMELTLLIAYLSRAGRGAEQTVE